MTKAKTNKQTKRVKVKSVSKEVFIRKDYIRRLIAGVRRQIRQDKETIAAKAECGCDVTINRWIDASLLCAVIEKEVLKNGDI